MSSFAKIVERTVRQPSASNLLRLVNYVASNLASLDDVALLATALARSGVMRPSSSANPTADVASTGGPSSLSTLLSPLYLRAMGCCVPKLGVAGRPAGGIDVMAQIPGFRVRLRPQMVERVIARNGYAHFIADETFAPLDAKLFRFRQQNRAQAVPDFVIASILAKKLAVGVTQVGLDIRVAPHGNFGATWNEARKNAKRFCRIAKLLGIRAVGLLTDAQIPYQPHIGRSEALQGLSDIFEQRPCPWLKRHDNLCFALARLTFQRKQARPSASEIKAFFTEHLRGQGASFDGFNRVIRRMQKQAKTPLTSKQEGFLSIHLDLLRTALTAVQNRYASASNPFPDPCGIVLTAMPGDYVWPGDTIAYVRGDQAIARKLARQVHAAFTVTGASGRQPVIEEVRDA